MIEVGKLVEIDMISPRMAFEILVSSCMVWLMFPSMIKRDFLYFCIWVSCWIKRLFIIEEIKSETVFLSIAIFPIR